MKKILLFPLILFTLMCSNDGEVMYESLQRKGKPNKYYYKNELFTGEAVEREKKRKVGGVKPIFRTTTFDKGVDVDHNRYYDGILLPKKQGYFVDQLVYTHVLAEHSDTDARKRHYRDLREEQKKRYYNLPVVADWVGRIIEVGTKSIELKTTIYEQGFYEDVEFTITPITDTDLDYLQFNKGSLLRFSGVISNDYFLSQIGFYVDCFSFSNFEKNKTYYQASMQDIEAYQLEKEEKLKSRDELNKAFKDAYEEFKKGLKEIEF